MNIKTPHASETNRSHRDQLITQGDLEIFKTELFAMIKAMIREEVLPKLSKKWLKSEEVKKLLNISTGTLQNLRNNGSLPYSKIGGRIYYNQDNIDKLMENPHDLGQNELLPTRKRYF